MVYIDESGFRYDIPRTHGYYEIVIHSYCSSDWNANIIKRGIV